MKVVEELNEETRERLEALIITGDGRSEFRRLKPLVDHYDEDRVLLFPSRPERHLQIVGRGSTHPDTARRGWDALEAIQLYKSKYNHTRFLFIVDKEHCERYGRAELEEKITDLATDDETKIEELGNGAYVAEFRIGREIVLYTAVVGDEFGFFEDDLAELIELEWGNEIDEDDKDEFKSTVNQILSGGSGRSLLENADRENLDRAFESLSVLLQQFEA